MHILPYQQAGLPLELREMAGLGVEESVSRQSMDVRVAGQWGVESALRQSMDVRMASKVPAAVPLS